MEITMVTIQSGYEMMLVITNIVCGMEEKIEIKLNKMVMHVIYINIETSHC